MTNNDVAFNIQSRHFQTFLKMAKILINYAMEYLLMFHGKFSECLFDGRFISSFLNLSKRKVNKKVSVRSLFVN